MKIQDLCPVERPREKLLKNGVREMSSAELLAILISSGVQGESAVDIAQRMLADHEGSLSDLSTESVDKLTQRTGIGPARASILAAAFEIGRRMGGEAVKSRPVNHVTGPRDAYSLVSTSLRGLGVEECHVIFLGKSNNVLGSRRITVGGPDSTIFDVRLISKMAVEKLASGIILVHNHPSGNPRPSQADISATAKLSEALETFDIRLLDHIIVSDTSYFSMNENRLQKI